MYIHNTYYTGCCFNTDSKHRSQLITNNLQVPGLKTSMIASYSTNLLLIIKALTAHPSTHV